MSNTNSKFYTNKQMANICGVSEPSMTNLVRTLELVPTKIGQYGRKYYNSKDLQRVKEHYKNKANSATKPKQAIKDEIIKEQQSHIDDLKNQIMVLNRQLEIKDSQIKTQNEQIKQNTILLSQAHTLTLQAQQSKVNSLSSETQQTSNMSTNVKKRRFWSWFTGKN